MRSRLRNTRPYRATYDWYRRNDRLASLLLRARGDTVTLDGARIHVGAARAGPTLRAEYWFDRYERAERELVARHVPTDLPVIELGGGIGVISSILNRRLADPTRHVLLEANPALIPLIERNRGLNDGRFEVRNLAYSATAETVSLELDGDYTVGRAVPAGSGTVTVPAASLARIADEAGFATFSLISDTEGGELSMIDREIDVLVARVAVLVVELHRPEPGDGTMDDRVDRLVAHGFELVDRERTVHVLRNTALLP